MKKYILSFVMCATFMLSGCASKTQLVDMENDTTDIASALEYRDFDKAAKSMVTNMIMSGNLDKPSGGRYVLIISRIMNDTMQRIDVDQLSKKIRVELINSGKVMVSNVEEDARVMQSRQLRNSKEFNQAGVAQKGTLIAPELSLSGKISQREFRVGRQKRIEYTFSLSITMLQTGITLWEGEETIIKLADKNAVSW